jgi:uncharacterized protein YcnI
MNVLSRRRLGSLARSRAARVAAVTSALTLAVYALGLAHAVVYPKASTTGAYERYVIRVPNERKVPTTRVEITFPSGLRVNSFADVPGWNLDVARDSAQRIIGAVWTGSLPPERFIEFPFVAANPKTAGQIVWPIIQTYADGERAEWTGPAGSKRPASATTITAAAAAGSTGGMNGVAIAALAIAVVSLGLALRPKGPNRPS